MFCSLRLRVLGTLCLDWSVPEFSSLIEDIVKPILFQSQFPLFAVIFILAVQGTFEFCMMIIYAAFKLTCRFDGDILYNCASALPKGKT